MSFFFHAYDIFPSLCKQGSVLYNYIKTGELKRSDGSSITEGNKIHSFLVGEININPIFRELLRFVWRGKFFRKTLSLWQTSHPLTRRMNRNNNTPTFRTGELMQWDATSIKTCYSIRMRRFFTVFRSRLWSQPKWLEMFLPTHSTFSSPLAIGIW